MKKTAEPKTTGLKTIKVKSSTEIPKNFTGIVEYSFGTKFWYKEGEYHREDGPACEYSDGSKIWYLNGTEYTEIDWKAAVKKMKAPKIKTIKLEFSDEIPKNFTGIVEYSDGHKEWYKKGKIHREDGPACECVDGTKFWYKEGKHHREDGPAVEWADGTKYWYKEGKLHREDGPAVEWADGHKEWYKKGKIHREDGPACECVDGDKYWYKEGKRHREDGPALEFGNGRKCWYLNDIRYTKKDWKAAIKELTKPKTTVKKTIPKKTLEAKKTGLKTIKVTFGYEVPKNFTGVAEFSNGDKAWYKEGKHHREDGPAVEWADGTKYWYKEGKLHREDGPAVEWADGTKYWYKEGKIHREDGPAIEYSNGSKQWYKEGKRHREDGPAIEYSNGSKQWYKEGKWHREDGPAIESSNGTKFWYLNGLMYSEKDFNENLKTIKVKFWAEIPKNFTGVAEFSNGDKVWYKEGNRHREDGPAVEWADGTKEWYKEGNQHREDGPAVEWADGTKEWYKEGKLHREDGPAIESSNGTKFWYLNGLMYSEKDFNENLKVIKIKKAAEIPDGFTGVAHFPDGDKAWIKDGKYHRDDGPALEFGNGRKCWYKDGDVHREDGPAIEYEDGRKEWWFKGLCYSQEEYSSLMKSASKIPQTETSKQKLSQIVSSDSKEVALRIAVQKINLLSKSILLKLFQKTKYSKMEDILNSEIGKAMLKAITSALLEMLKSKFDDKYKLVLDEISKEFRIQAEADLSVELLTKIEAYLQSSPTLSVIQTRISIEDFNSEQIEVDNNQEIETTLLVSSNNSMLN